MRAISSLSFEAGISTRECFAAMALRIRVNISAIGSVINSTPFLIANCQLPILENWKLAIGNWQCSYQLDLTTPGICPCSANSRKQMRHRLNFRKYPRGLPQRLQRVYARTENFGFRAAF